MDTEDAARVGALLDAADHQLAMVAREARAVHAILDDQLARLKGWHAELVASRAARRVAAETPAEQSAWLARAEAEMRAEIDKP